jgi:hypothetical protein
MIWAEAYAIHRERLDEQPELFAGWSSGGR